MSRQKKGPLTIQGDEMWLFVNDKGNKQWIWLALDVTTREIVDVHVGARSEQGARQLWNSLPSIYRQCAVAYTNFWLPIPISGRLMVAFFRSNVTRQWGRRRGKPAISNASTVRCARESFD